MTEKTDLRYLPVSLVIFILFSVFSGFTRLGDYYAHIVLTFLSVLFLSIFIEKSFSKRALAFISVFAVIIAVAYLEAGRYLHLAGKILHIINIISLSFLLLRYRISAQALRAGFALFIVSSLVLGLFSFSNGSFDYGIFQMPRFSGGFTDANYFAFVNFMFLLSFKSHNDGMTSIFRAVCLISILLSQSWTVVCLWLMYRFGILSRIGRVKFRIVLIFPIFFIFIALFTSYFEIQGNWKDNIVVLKTNSLLFRWNAILVAIENVTADPFRLLFGFGSGVSEELNGRILHSSVFQSFLIMASWVSFVYY